MQFKFSNLLPALSASLILISSLAPAWAEEGASTVKKSTSTPAATGTTTTKTAAKPSTGASTAATASKTATAANKGKVATVNGTAITQEQYDRAMAPYEAQIAALGEGVVTEEKKTEIKNSIIENLIGTELLYKESQKMGVKVEEAAVTKAYESQKTQLGSESAFQDALKQANFTEGTFKDQIRMGLSIQELINSKFANKTTISDEEIKKFYDENPDQFKQEAQVRASHIMFMFDADADQAKKDALKQEAEKVLKRLKAGEDFATLVKEVSQDPYTKESDGDLGYFARGEMMQSFEDKAFSLKIGDISDIVESEYGYHIIKVTDKVAAKTVSYDESKEQIRDYLKTTKVNSDVNKYVSEMRAKATVEILLK